MTDSSVSLLVEAALVFAGILGGAMSVCSGVLAVPALVYPVSTDQLSRFVCLGLGLGFVSGFPSAVAAVILTLVGEV